MATASRSVNPSIPNVMPMPMHQHAAAPSSIEQPPNPPPPGAPGTPDVPSPPEAPPPKVEPDIPAGTSPPPASYDLTPYAANMMVYPSDLVSDEKTYGGNYVVFFINVRSSSGLVKDNPDAVITDAKLGLGSGGQSETAASLSNIAVNNAIRGVVNGVSTVFRAVQTANNRDVARLDRLGAAGQAVSHSNRAIQQSVGFPGLVKAAATESYIRLKESICLYVPNDVSINYSTDWMASSTISESMVNGIGSGIVGSAAIATDMADAANNAAQSALDSIKGLFGNSADSQQTNMSGGSNTMAQVMRAALYNLPGEEAALVSRASSRAINPKREQIFNQVNFRSFSFAYHFYPRNEIELKTVEKIIKTFKYHMHPEYTSSAELLYIYPSEFDIAYFNNGQKNTHLHTHTACVLTDLKVNYTPMGVFATHENGAPVQIDIDLTFMELATLTKNNIDLASEDVGY